VSGLSGFCSMFDQPLKLFPRTEFQALVERTHAERHARGFTCWGQFVAMLFEWAHFRRTKSAVKLHCLLDHDGYLPSVVIVTEGKRHDVRVARAASSLRLV
jgi:hypothetical protein